MSLYVILLYIVLMAVKPTRKFALALTPWAIFACCYDSMRYYPNYLVRDIDVRHLYDAEKAIFGITAEGMRLIPGEFFARHHNTLADIMAGFFYLCWVPVPMAFGIYLYFKGEHDWYLRFSLAFLLVNLIGFCGYYIYPAAPPWYAMQYGFDPVMGTPGNVAGLGRFDDLVGAPVFHHIYGQNANVFAAVPSLHAAYMLIATFYAVMSKRSRLTIAAFAFICAGIWWTAVYSGHHYIIDVLLGIFTALAGMHVLEKWILAVPVMRRAMDRYVEAIK